MLINADATAGVRPGQHGFSMIEILVTIVVLTFGLLGVAGLLVKGMTVNHGSYLRSLAIQQAYDMADRIRANRTGATAGNYDSVTFTANQTCTVCTATCTAQTLATFDACHWNRQNESLLPLGQGTVARSGSSTEYLITVSWDDNKSGSANKSIAMRVQP